MRDSNEMQNESKGNTNDFGFVLCSSKVQETYAKTKDYLTLCDAKVPCAGSAAPASFFQSVTITILADVLHGTRMFLSCAQVRGLAK